MSYWMFMALGYISMLVLMVIFRKHYQLTAFKSVLYATVVLVFGVLGCKLLFILENINHTIHHGVTFSGFSFFGSVALVPLCAPLFGKLLGMKRREAADAAAFLVVVMLAVIRIGCFSVGCCGGIHGHLFGKDIVYPTQLMESAGDFAILALLLTWVKKDKHKGLLYPTFLVCYAPLRFLIEFLRDTPKDWLGLSHGQVFALAAFLVGALFLCAHRKGAAIPECSEI